MITVDWHQLIKLTSPNITYPLNFTNMRTVRSNAMSLNHDTNCIKNKWIHHFSLRSRVTCGNLVLRHSVPNFRSIFMISSVVFYLFLRVLKKIKILVKIFWVSQSQYYKIVYLCVSFSFFSLFYFLMYNIITVNNLPRVVKRHFFVFSHNFSYVKML